MKYAIVPTHDSEEAIVHRRYAPNLSWCGRCGMPWSAVKGHTTYFDEHSGCFPLCGACWELLETPEARMPYYEELINLWGRGSEDGPLPIVDQVAIFQAVQNGG